MKAFRMPSTVAWWFMAALCAYAATENVVATIQPEPDGVAQLRNALEAIRTNNTDMQGDIIIEIADGTLSIDTPFLLDESCSGANGHNVIFRAASGAKPVISRGTRIENWTEDEHGRWRAPLNGKRVRQLFVNDVRAQRARGPFPEGAERYGNLKAIDADAGFIVPNGEMAQWRNPSEIVFGFFNSWSHMTCDVAAIAADPDGRARVRMRMPAFMLMSRKEGVRAEMPAYIENAIEVLDEPGEWYADASTGAVYYMPRAGEDMTSASAVITGNDELLHIGGRSDERAHHIRFEGITFAEAAANDPDTGGHADVQANFVITTENSYERDGYLVNLHNEYIKPRAAIVVGAASDIVFDGCTFTRIGGAALNLDAAQKASDVATQDVTIRNCTFFDIGGSAIQVGDVNRYAHHPLDDEHVVRNIRIENCRIHNIGSEYEDSVAVFAGYVQKVEIIGNEMHDLPYSGISIGWGWGEEDAGGSTYPIPYIYESPTPASDNRIANNHIYRVMQKRLDGGGIYTLGNQPGTIIEGNHIHDNKGWPGGIYLDEGSGFIEVRNNRVYNVPTPMNFNNRNQDRIETCNVHDNDFAEPQAK
ncbi:MAG: right-handed parallel beta-helix repeat-containing protein [Candidatus Hydrogenedentes bacterium]|nr:right-handed parallel beta-helix repeat-containing protein [Candidatus Hydrogenedentota bacterium]